jgi:hypothetical protein
MAPRGVSTWRRPYTSIYNDNYRYGTGLYSDTLTDIEKRYSDSISRTQLRSDRPDLTFSAFSGSNLTSSATPASGDSGKDDLYSPYTYMPPRQQQPQSPSPLPEIVRSPTFETRLNATLKSAASALDEDVDEVIRTRIEQRKQAIARSVSEAEKSEADEDDDFRRRMEIRKKALERAKTATEIKSSKSTTASDSDQQQYVSKSSKKVTTSEETKVKPTSLYDDASLWTLSKTSNKTALDLDLDTSKSRRKAGGRQTPTNGPTSSRWKDKSRDLQDQVDSLEKSMSDGSTRLRSELTSLKSKYNTELYDLSGSVENTTQQATDLHRLCKRQATELQELQSAYNSAQRNIQDVLEEMNVWQNKCKSLKKEMDRLREDVEMAVNKRSKA